MGERSHAAIDLQALSDTSLRGEVERGNEAARALLLSRRLATLSSVLSRLDTGSNVAEVHVRLEIIDSILADLVRGRPEDLAPASDPALAVSNSALEHGDDLNGDETAALSGTHAVNDEQSWRAFLGPLLTVDEAARHLRLRSPKEIDELVARGSVLALPMSNGATTFPAFQFRPDGTVVPIIERVVTIFQGIVTTPYTIASWLRGPKDYLNAQSPIQWLEDGGDPDLVIRGAERAATQLGQ